MLFIQESIKSKVLLTAESICIPSLNVDYILDYTNHKRIYFKYIFIIRYSSKNKQRLIKPKNPIPQEGCLPSEVKLVPKWHIVPTNRQQCTLPFKDNASRATNESSKPCLGNDWTSKASKVPTEVSPIQTMRPTSEPRKATLMTEDGPIDVSIKL